MVIPSNKGPKIMCDNHKKGLVARKTAHVNKKTLMIEEVSAFLEMDKFRKTPVKLMFLILKILA